MQGEHLEVATASKCRQVSIRSSAIACLDSLWPISARSFRFKLYRVCVRRVVGARGGFDVHSISPGRISHVSVVSLRHYRVLCLSMCGPLRFTLQRVIAHLRLATHEGSVHAHAHTRTSVLEYSSAHTGHGHTTHGVTLHISNQFVPHRYWMKNRGRRTIKLMYWALGAPERLFCLSRPGHG